jgi:hypothetical protein
MKLALAGLAALRLAKQLSGLGDEPYYPQHPCSELLDKRRKHQNVGRIHFSQAWLAESKRLKKAVDECMKDHPRRVRSGERKLFV